MKAIKAIAILAISVVLLSASSNSFGQIESVSLQASGLTCSMCSRAIYKSLKKVSNVGKVDEDIEHSSYHILFVNPSAVSLAALKKAVMDAGFSVARMEVAVDFEHLSIGNDSSMKVNELVFHFVSVTVQTLNGNRRLLIVDKDYLLDKDRKKYAGSYEAGLNSYHVTLPQS